MGGSAGSSCELDAVDFVGQQWGKNASYTPEAVFGTPTVPNWAVSGPAYLLPSTV